MAEQKFDPDKLRPKAAHRVNDLLDYRKLVPGTKDFAIWALSRAYVDAKGNTQDLICSAAQSVDTEKAFTDAYARRAIRAAKDVINNAPYTL